MPRRRTTRRTPARRLLLVLALYALAAILSLAAAIGASAFTPQWASEAAWEPEDGDTPGSDSWRNWIGECQYVVLSGDPLDNPDAQYTFRYGFPFRCVYSQGTRITMVDDHSDFSWTYEATFLWEIVPQTGHPTDGPPQIQQRSYVPLADPPIAIPTGILPLGLLANTLTLGTALLLAILATRTAIAHRRRGKGRCPSCNYTLTGLPATTPCPECGCESAVTVQPTEH